MVPALSAAACCCCRQSHCDGTQVSPRILFLNSGFCTRLSCMLSTQVRFGFGSSGSVSLGTAVAPLLRTQSCCRCRFSVVPLRCYSGLLPYPIPEFWFLHASLVHAQYSS